MKALLIEKPFAGFLGIGIEEGWANLSFVAKVKARGTVRSTTPPERRRIEREIERIKQAVLLGKATGTLLEMLEDHERRLATLAAAGNSNGDAVPARLGRVLDQLPALVHERLGDLEALLADKQIERGKQILAAFETMVRIHPMGDHVEVEVAGRLEGIFTLLGTTGGQKRWLGEEDSNPR